MLLQSVKGKLSLLELILHYKQFQGSQVLRIIWLNTSTGKSLHFIRHQRSHIVHCNAF